MEYLTNRVIPRSKDRFQEVNCTASEMKDKRTDLVRKVMAADLKDLMMLQNGKKCPNGHIYSNGHVQRPES